MSLDIFKYSPHDFFLLIYYIIKHLTSIVNMNWIILIFNSYALSLCVDLQQQMHSLIHGMMMLMSSSTTWTTPSPSHMPMDPPTEERRKLRVGCTREVVVTSTVSGMVMLITLSLLSHSARNLASVEVVVQGRGQSEDSVPSNRSQYWFSEITMCRIRTLLKMAQLGLQKRRL